LRSLLQHPLTPRNFYSVEQLFCDLPLAHFFYQILLLFLVHHCVLVLVFEEESGSSSNGGEGCPVTIVAVANIGVITWIVYVLILLAKLNMSNGELTLQQFVKFRLKNVA
jgi:hypothetical protein